jgi:magnesium transporter
MIEYFVFSKGKLVRQDSDLGFLRVALYEEDVQIWVDVEQPNEQETNTLLEGVFSFHPLAIEDCVAVSERPKIDQYDTYLFMVIHAIDFSQSQHAFGTTELNMFIGKNFLVTYHQDPLRSVSVTKERLLKSSSAVAKAPDRLTYNILDVLLDNYDPALDSLAADMADLEKNILTSKSMETLNDILQLKNQVQNLRQIMAPQREVIGRLARGEFPLVRPHMLPYYRDLLDRLARITDASENYRESLTNMIHVLLNLQQSQINQVIKVLTVLATLSTPMLVVTSFYGMNVKHMPNTDWPSWPYAYLWVLSVTALITGLITYYLKKKDWL